MPGEDEVSESGREATTASGGFGAAAGGGGLSDVLGFELAGTDAMGRAGPSEATAARRSGVCGLDMEAGIIVGASALDEAVTWR
jgi:hypothetical protein